MFYLIPHLSVYIGYIKQSSNANIRLQTNLQISAQHSSEIRYCWSSQGEYKYFVSGEPLLDSQAIDCFTRKEKLVGDKT